MQTEHAGIRASRWQGLQDCVQLRCCRASRCWNNACKQPGLKRPAFLSSSVRMIPNLAKSVTLPQRVFKNKPALQSWSAKKNSSRMYFHRTVIPPMSAQIWLLIATTGSQSDSDAKPRAKKKTPSCQTLIPNSGATCMLPTQHPCPSMGFWVLIIHISTR